MNRTLFFLADGKPEVGLGHLRRSEGLAYAAKERGWHVMFLERDPYGSEWLRANGWEVEKEMEVILRDLLVIDSYTISDDEIKKHKKRFSSLVGFHDTGEPQLDFDLLVSGGSPEDRKINSTLILGGAAYQIIHPDILNAKREPLHAEVQNIVVTLGGAPKAQKSAKKIGAEIEKKVPQTQVVFVGGMKRKDVAQAFAHADVAISGGGQTMFELLYLGVPAIIVVMSEDQEGQVALARERGALEAVFHMHDAGLEAQIAQSVQDLYSVQDREKLSAAAKKTVDGKGAQRILTKIERLI